MIPEDVLIDAGGKYPAGTERDPNSKPGAHAKHVVFRADRADGFVGRNFLLKGAREHGFYTEESDGTRLDRTKFFWNADYGHLSFTSDHQLIQNCDGYGSGDSVVYPGAAPETGAQTSSFWPDAPRKNATVTDCDLRGSALGYSGSMGNAVRITRNHIYGNTTGISSDTLSAAGHPGFPADSSEIDNNLIYSNNLDLYKPNAPVNSLVPVPIGVGIIYPGMNDSRVHDNHIFDNWRDGARLFAVPDALVNGGGGEGDIAPGIACPDAPANGISTSCGNQMYNNQMGMAPAGFTFPAEASDFGNVRSSGTSRKMPNGTDFWWDEFAGNTKNCWFNNKGSDGTPASITGPGAGSAPDPLPSNCQTSTGTGDTPSWSIELDCADGPDEETGPLSCPWLQTPPKPAGGASRSATLRSAAAAKRFEKHRRGRQAAPPGPRAVTQVAVRLVAGRCCAAPCWRGAPTTAGVSARALPTPACVPRSRAPRPAWPTAASGTAPRSRSAGSRSRTCAGSSPSRAARARSRCCRTSGLTRSSSTPARRPTPATCASTRSTWVRRRSSRCGRSSSRRHSRRHTLLKKPSAA